MKKVALLIDTMNGGGAQRVVSHLSGILKDDYDLHVVLFDDKYHEFTCQGTQHCLNVPAVNGSAAVKLKLLAQRIKKLKELIKKEKLDCVISFMDSPNFVNLFAKVGGCRKIISIRNYSGLENRQSTLGKLTDAAMKLLYRRADCVVTVSKLIEQDFMTHYGIPEKKIRTIYNPYNFEEMLEKGNVPLTETEQRFYDSGFVFLNVGRIMYQKGIWHLVKAFSLVQAKHPETRLVLVGEDLSDGKLTTLLENLNLTDRVMLTGRTRNPYQYMKNADCYVLSSLFEGFPNAMVEAMACGCPVIAADCKSGPREILYEQVDLEKKIEQTLEADHGILIPELESEENWDPQVITEGERKLAQAMERVCQNREECRCLSQAATKRSTDFGFETCKNQYDEAICVH